MPAFRLSAKALEDLRAIGRHTQQKWGIEQRNKYLSMLDEGFHSIAKHPGIGKDCGYIRTGYRKYHVGRHLIFYRQGVSDIEIMRILHDCMDVPRHLNWNL